MSNQRPPSQRPPTSGVPVGMRPPSRTRMGTEVNAPSRGINVINRPMSKQGLPSANMQNGGRQVADKSYFIGILRSRINDTIAELKRIQDEIENRKRGQSIQVSLQQQVEEIKNQIAENEAELADYNVLSDRVASGVSVDEMVQSYQELEKSNNEHEQEVNRLFREKRDLDSIVSDQERQVQEMMKGAGSATLQEMAKEVESLEEQCQKLRSQTGDLQGKSREQLLQMVKEATTKIGDADRQILDEQKALTYVQNQIKSLAEREGDLKTENGQKYLKLLKKEKDMTTFLQNYPQALETTKRELAESQRSVFDVLVATSRDLESIENLPSVTNFKQLESDLELKKRQMQDAQSTAEKLSAEVEQRRQDFENLQNVDVKIKEEIELIKKQMKDMEDELPNFDDVTSVREDGELKKKRMTVERDQLKQQLHQLRKATNALASKYNETRSGIRANEINNKLHALEKEIRTRAAENFAIVECIEDNRRRTNYSLVKRASMNIVAEINSFL